MSEKKIHKSEAAKQQLITAVMLFLHGMDRSSAITLAGAAGNILDQLVRNSGKKPFIDYAREVHNDIIGFTPKRKSYAHYIDKKLGIITHKHLGKNEPNEVELDLENLAADSISRCLADYTQLYGKEEWFVKAFFAWAWSNCNGKAIVEAYKNGTLHELAQNRITEPQTKIYTRFQLAESQLRTAIQLFLTEKDRLASITLSGAADVLFCRLVEEKGEENFTDLTLRDELEKGEGPITRSEHGRQINDELRINALKHLDKGEDGFVEIDELECAIAAILKVHRDPNWKPEA